MALRFKNEAEYHKWISQRSGVAPSAGKNVHKHQHAVSLLVAILLGGPFLVFFWSWAFVFIAIGWHALFN